MGYKYLLALFVMIVSLISCSKSEQTREEGSTTEQAKAEEKEKTSGSFEVNACSLITRQEAEDLLGEELQEPREDQHVAGEQLRAAMSHCLIPSDSGKRISIFFRKSPISDNSPESIQAVKNTIGSEDAPVEDVNGVGDTAFWGSNQLHIFEGDRSYIIITVDGFADAGESNDKARKVAEIALERV